MKLEYFNSYKNKSTKGIVTIKTKVGMPAQNGTHTVLVRSEKLMSEPQIPIEFTGKNRKIFRIVSCHYHDSE